MTMGYIVRTVMVMDLCRHVLIVLIWDFVNLLWKKADFNMTNQPTPNETSLRINEICLSILDQLNENDIEFNNLNRDIERALHTNGQFLQDDELTTIFMKSFFEVMKKYIVGKKKSGISMNEIQNRMKALELTMMAMFQKMKNDVITKH